MQLTFSELPTSTNRPHNATGTAKIGRPTSYRRLRGGGGDSPQASSIKNNIFKRLGPQIQISQRNLRFSKVKHRLSKRIFAFSKEIWDFQRKSKILNGNLWFSIDSHGSLWFLIDLAWKSLIYNGFCVESYDFWLIGGGYLWFFIWLGVENFESWLIGRGNLRSLIGLAWESLVFAWLDMEIFDFYMILRGNPWFGDG